MAQKKLHRFAEIRTFSNVLEYPYHMRGKWNEFFKNDGPIILELACGKGEYALGLGRLYPGKNFLGVDLKGNRLWVGAKKALSEQLSNVGFVRTQIDKLNSYFLAGDIAEIWITFPDPQLRTSKARKRLTHPRFLRIYQQMLSPGGKVHLKTDSPDLYRFTKSVIELYGLVVTKDSKNIYADSEVGPELSIQTYYESLDIAKSNRIFYLQFLLPAATLPDKDHELKEIIVEQEADRRN